MRTRQVQLQTIGDGSKPLRHGNKLVNRTAKYRDEQKSILGNTQFTQTLQRLLHAWVGKAYRIDETTRRILAIDGFSITQTRFETDAFGGDDPHLRHGINHPLND